MRGRVGAVAFLLAMGMMAARAQAPETQVPTQEPAPHGGTPDLGQMQQQAAVDAMAAKGPLKISFGQQSAQWTLEQLAVLPHRTVTVHNEHTKADETYSGVPLLDLLVKVGVPDKPRGKDLSLYLVAVGADGYKAVYSVAEINPDVHDAMVLVADQEGGKSIGADGPLKLVATRETRPARWVRNLVGVRVMAAQ